MKEPKDTLILIVDDEVILSRAISRDMQKKGYRTVCAASVREALEIVKNQKVDVVLSDIRMPNENGIDLLNLVKAYNTELPVVLLMTGFSDVTLEEAYHLGADGIYSKPFDRKQLYEGIRRAITPKDKLWSEQSTLDNLNHKVTLTFPDINLVLEKKIVILGRGGMFVACSEPMPTTDSHVSFKIEFNESEHPAIEGAGIVRWVRNRPEPGYPCGLGVEFVGLNDTCRHHVLEIIRSLRSKSFIPRI